jgi:hypothetical protein
VQDVSLYFPRTATMNNWLGLQKARVPSCPVYMLPDVALTNKLDDYKVNVTVSITNKYECDSKRITDICLDSDLTFLHVSNKYCVLLDAYKSGHENRLKQYRLILSTCTLRIEERS